MKKPCFYWASETTGVLDIPDGTSLEYQRRIWWMAQTMRTLNGVREVVPGMNNLSVDLRHDAKNVELLLEALRDHWEQSVAVTQISREITIPVCYGGNAGPDLEVVAAHTGLTADEVINLHTRASYTVFFLGFLPGFAYLGGLDSRLSTPRRAEPRLSVPGGSVGIGGSQTGIYPLASPGGWQLIGLTKARLFDPASDPTTLLLPGDIVRFVEDGCA